MTGTRHLSPFWRHQSPLWDCTIRDARRFACQTATGGPSGSAASVRRPYRRRRALELSGVDFWAKALRTKGAGETRPPTRPADRDDVGAVAVRAAVPTAVQSLPTRPKPRMRQLKLARPKASRSRHVEARGSRALRSPGARLRLRKPARLTNSTNSTPLTPSTRSTGTSPNRPMISRYWKSCPR